MKVKRILALILVMISMVSLVGCGGKDRDPLMSESKETLVEMINRASEDEVYYVEKIEELEERIRGQVSSSPVTSGIGEIGAGIELTFKTIDSKIIFPTEFNFPGSEQAPSTSSLNVSEAVKIRPTSNWTFKVTGTGVELSHNSGITCVMTTGKLDSGKYVERSVIEEHLLDNFFSELPPSKVAFSSLHIDDAIFGVDSVCSTTIDEGPAMLRCGMLAYGELTFHYFFVYLGERDVAKDEVILSLMRTVTIWDNELSISE